MIQDTNTASGAAEIATRLRNACASVRNKSYPLADLIPLMQQAADALTSAASQPVAPAHTRALENVALLADILNRRPAMNAGLTEAYAHWTNEVYNLMGTMAREPANDAALASAAAPAQQPTPSAAAEVNALPEGWVPLVITHEGQHPEEVAYGPQIMMDRLGKWLGKYFDHVVASKAQAAPTADAPTVPEGRYGFWVTHLEHDPDGFHNGGALSEREKAEGWTEVALTVAPQPSPTPQADSQPAPDEFQPCPSCFGTGVDGDADDYGRTIDVTCGECDGSGRAKTKADSQPAPAEAMPPISDPKKCTAQVRCINGRITTESCTTKAPLISNGESSDGERDYYICPDCRKDIVIDYREN